MFYFKVLDKNQGSMEFQSIFRKTINRKDSVFFTSSYRIPLLVAQATNLPLHRMLCTDPSP